MTSAIDVWYFGSGRSPMNRRMVTHTTKAAWKEEIIHQWSHQQSPRYERHDDILQRNRLPIKFLGISKEVRLWLSWFSRVSRQWQLLPLSDPCSSYGLLHLFFHFLLFKFELCTNKQSESEWYFKANVVLFSQKREYS